MKTAAATASFSSSIILISSLFALSALYPEKNSKAKITFYVLIEIVFLTNIVAPFFYQFDIVTHDEVESILKDTQFIQKDAYDKLKGSYNLGGIDVISCGRDYNVEVNPGKIIILSRFCEFNNDIVNNSEFHNEDPTNRFGELLIYRAK